MQLVELNIKCTIVFKKHNMHKDSREKTADCVLRKIAVQMYHRAEKAGAYISL